MTNRITTCFRALARRSEKGLVTFVTAGDPDLALTEALLPELCRAGADIIELGMPFSDPMADGPTIQRASERALAAGTTLPAILAMIARVRGQVTAPIVLMGYTNPIYAYGFEAFARDAAQAGVDALLLVDLPPEEAGELLPALAKHKLELIFLATPTTTPERLKTITRHAGGFLYYVTVTGVTGVRSAEAKSVSASLARIKQTVSIPVVAGFGITTPDQAKAVGNDADGVVVGSALVKLFETDQRDTIIPAVTKLVHSLKNALID